MYQDEVTVALAEPVAAEAAVQGGAEVRTVEDETAVLDNAASAKSMEENVYARYLRWKEAPIVGEPYLSIVIPAYNESERIVPTIGAIAAYVCTLDQPWELLVADDGSKDDTVALCQDLHLANLNVLIAPKNGARENAVQRGCWRRGSGHLVCRC